MMARTVLIYQFNLIQIVLALEKFEREGEKNGMCDEVYRIHHHFEHEKPTTTFWQKIRLTRTKV
jgi:hypothetical protein